MKIYGISGSGRIYRDLQPLPEPKHEGGPSFETSKKYGGKWVEVDGKIYASIATAAKAMAVSSTKLGAAMQDGKTDIDGHKIRYASMLPASRFKRVVVDGVLFDNAVKAAEFIGCAASTVRNACACSYQCHNHDVRYLE